MFVLYGVIKLLSLVIRQFYLPNPFEMFDYGILYNLIATGLLVPITYVMVGFLYKRGSSPFIGSLLFFVFYLLNTLVVLVCSVFYFNIWVCLTLGTVYLVVFIMFVKSMKFAMGGYL